MSKVEPKLDKDGNEIVEEQFELDEAAVATIVEKTADAVVDKAKEGLDKTIGDAVTKSVDEKISGSVQDILDKHLEKTEEIERKAVEKANADKIKVDPVAKGIDAGDFDEKIAEMTPAMRM